MKQAALVLSLALFHAVHASAEPARPEEAPDTMTAEARRRFDEGRRATAEGDFERARIAYMQTYLLNQSPVVLRNLGMAEIKSGHPVLGARHLASYLRGDPAPTETPEQRSAARRALAEAEARIARLLFETDVPGAEITVDGQVVGRSPLAHEWHVQPGKRTVTLRKGGREQTKEVEAPAGELVRVSMALASSDSTALPEAEVSTRAPSSNEFQVLNSARNDALPLVLVIVAGAATAGSAITWYVSGQSAASAEKDVSRLLDRARNDFGDAPCTSSAGADTEQCAELQTRHDDGRTATTIKNYSRAATGFFLAGTAAALTYWITSREYRPKDRAADQLKLGTWAGSQGFGFAAVGSF